MPLDAVLVEVIEDGEAVLLPILSVVGLGLAQAVKGGGERKQ